MPIIKTQPAFEPAHVSVSFEDAAQADIRITDYDGIWASPDPRVLSLSNYIGLDARGFIYEGPAPAADMYQVAADLITQTPSSHKGTILIPRTKLTDKQAEFVGSKYSDYLKNFSDAFNQNVSYDPWAPEVDIAQELRIESMPKAEDMEWHIDWKGWHVENVRTAFLTVAGDKGTHIRTRNLHTIEAKPGELVIWRNGPEGAYHHAPIQPYTRMIWSKTVYPNEEEIKPSSLLRVCRL
ncbi:MAG TPA: hypothetical protein VFR09_00280 [Alphaproteobacteria bacterium]|nr:hypothetical protein [Alphaproteobacteria bacterium]